MEKRVYPRGVRTKLPKDVRPPPMEVPAAAGGPNTIGGVELATGLAERDQDAPQKRRQLHRQTARAPEGRRGAHKVDADGDDDDECPSGGTEIQDYAKKLKEEFFGKGSEFCEWMVPEGHVGPSVMAKSVDEHAGSLCSDGCWSWNWQTSVAIAELGVDGCLISDLSTQFPEYFDLLVKEKILAVHQELGFDLMVIIFTTVVIAFVSTLLLLSMSRRGDKPKHWANRFSLLVTVLNLLPLMNIYNFCSLSNRVVRIKLFYCDDFITDDCMVAGTGYWSAVMYFLVGCFVLVVLLHNTLPDTVTDADGEQQQDGHAEGHATHSSDPLTQLERLGALLQQGLLTEDEYAAHKARLLGLLATAAPEDRFTA
eukprot:2867301-Prymnesium_polylepis.1